MCVYTYIYIYIYIYMCYVCMYVCIHIYIYIYMYVLRFLNVSLKTPHEIHQVALHRAIRAAGGDPVEEAKVHS